MTENSPTLEEWRRLYHAAIRVKEIAPWEWTTETDVFGVQDPETDKLGFVSIMGMRGEHYAVAVYLGPQGLYRFWAFEDTGPLAPPEALLEIPHLQASFENRSELRKQDRETIKQLGLKFRGRHAWPMFRSYRPGFFPWFLEAEEACLLTYALEQVIDVAPRFRKDPSLLAPVDEQSYLVRVPRQRGDSLTWRDHILDVPPPEFPTISLVMDIQALEKLKRIPPSRNRLEIDFFMFPASIGERGARPAFPYMLLTVDAQSGMVLGSELLTADPSLEAMWGLIPMNVVYQLARFGIVPGEVRVRSGLLFELLRPLAQELRFKLKQSKTMNSLDSAKEFLLQRFM